MSATAKFVECIACADNPRSFFQFSEPCLMRALSQGFLLVPTEHAGVHQLNQVLCIYLSTFVSLGLPSEGAVQIVGFPAHTAFNTSLPNICNPIYRMLLH